MLWIASFSCAIDFWFHSTETRTGTLPDFSLSEFVMTFFWPNRDSITQNAPWVLENLYSAIVRQRSSYASVRFSLSVVSCEFKFSVPLLVFCLGCPVCY